MRHHSTVLNLGIMLIVLPAMAMSLAAPEAAASLAPWLVLFSVLIIGIPHGAIDHVMASELYGLGSGWRGQLLFYGGYLALMLVVALLWFFSPILGMMLFLGISMYHFGEADMQDFLVDGAGKGATWIASVARGLLIIVLIVFSDLGTTVPVMASAMRVSESLLYGFFPGPVLPVALTVMVYAVAMGVLVAKRLVGRAVVLIADTFILASMLLITGPLAGFALYFALWHSLGHVREMQQFFAGRGKPMSLGAFYKKAAPFTLVSVAGLLMLAFVWTAFEAHAEFLALMFVLISVLTLPHMFIVNRMYGVKGEGAQM